ncbi:MAG: MarR family transcriptional regulator [Prolixibacteraceae bacterium]
MSSKYDFLRLLIDLYEEYEQEEKHPDLLGFAQWTINRLEEEPKLNQQIDLRDRQKDKTASNQFLDDLKGKARFLEVVARIARYHEFYTRKALKESAVNTRLEFLFLRTVDRMERARKTDLISSYHLEYTTGMDTIRRLKNNGLLYEVPDEADKRVRLLELTDKGKEVLALSLKRFSDENTMFFAATSENKWKKALPALEELEAIHNQVYKNHNEKPFAELANLMDSLKRYYQ